MYPLFHFLIVTFLFGQAVLNFLFSIFFIKLYLIYNIVLVLGVQQSYSVLYVYKFFSMIGLLALWVWFFL